VTNAQYKIFAEVEKTGWKADAPDDHPAVNVSWEEAIAYCRWLDEQVKGQLPVGYEIRLPTEAEWEKAARGPYGNEWPWGNEWDAKKCNSSEGGPGRTTAVGAYSAVGGDSPYGVADMAGNVWEWCWDWYAEDEYRKRTGKEGKDPVGPKKGSYHVLRGGAFLNSRAVARCAYRGGNLLLNRNDNVGWRVVAALPVSR
jgi:formylglycine-generating enzyme required for sulfatase activity